MTTKGKKSDEIKSSSESKSRRIALISCVSKKLTLPDGEKAKAKDLYISPLFKKAMAYTKKVIKPDELFILSAEHHLLHPETKISTYNKTLNSMNAGKRREWTEIVKSQMLEADLDLDNDVFFILAGKKYYQYLIGEDGIKNYELVYKNCRGIGYILNFLNKNI